MKPSTGGGSSAAPTAPVAPMRSCGVAARGGPRWRARCRRTTGASVAAQFHS
uniref:Uncharacterized protein n=1 Tax=Arundo donax TaxID=35708 RepID=A0A0A8YHY8_ARUDO